MAKKPLSNRQYLTRSGMCCPACHKNSVEGDSPELDEGDDLALQRTVRCNDCLAKWVEEFTMTGIRDIISGTGHEVSNIL